jgi:hypothetical protein
VSEGFGLKSILVNVATAGTAVPLSASTLWVENVWIIASTGNTGDVYLGGSDGSSANGFPLDNAHPNNRVNLSDIQSRGTNECWDLSKIYVDAANSDEDVYVLYSVK